MVCRRARPEWDHPEQLGRGSTGPGRHSLHRDGPRGQTGYDRLRYVRGGRRVDDPRRADGTNKGRYESAAAGYGTAAPASPHELGEIVYISVLTSTAKLTDPDSMEGEGTHAFFLPSADADGDGLSDEGQKPAICFPFTFAAKRVTVVTSWEPSPGHPACGSGSSTAISENGFARTATLVIGGQVYETAVSVVAGEIVVDDDGTQHVTASHTFAFEDRTGFTTTDEETGVPTETPGLYTLTGTLVITEGDYAGKLQVVRSMDFASEPPKADYRLCGWIYPIEVE